MYIYVDTYVDILAHRLVDIRAMVASVDGYSSSDQGPFKSLAVLEIVLQDS